jgi:hypothetical protein
MEDNKNVFILTPASQNEKSITLFVLLTAGCLLYAYMWHYLLNSVYKFIQVVMNKHACIRKYIMT